MQVAVLTGCDLFCCFDIEYGFRGISGLQELAIGLSVCNDFDPFNRLMICSLLDFLKDNLTLGGNSEVLA